uniref:Uncharacterized protein n=1 Tax=Rhizophora mucronata TaxID=61149 RepID=A0A2P2J4Z2_RHIMU
MLDMHAETFIFDMLGIVLGYDLMSLPNQLLLIPLGRFTEAACVLLLFTLRKWAFVYLVFSFQSIHNDFFSL